MNNVLRAALVALGLFLGGAMPAWAQSADVVTMMYVSADRHGIDPALLDRVIRCESTYRPHVVSPWGDRGIAQFNRITWEEQAPRFGIPANFDFAFDPELSIDLMAALFARGQSWRWRACL